jgi:hypothetical protein
MEVTTINPVVLTGQGMASGALPLAPAGGDPTMPGGIQVSFANPGDGILAEATEPMPPHILNGGPPALAAPAPQPVGTGPEVTGEPGSSGTSTGEPQTMYSVPLQGAS